MAKSKNWIQKAIKNPGALRKQMGVKAGSTDCGGVGPAGAGGIR